MRWQMCVSCKLQTPTNISVMKSYVMLRRCTSLSVGSEATDRQSPPSPPTSGRRDAYQTIPTCSCPYWWGKLCHTDIDLWFVSCLVCVHMCINKYVMSWESSWKCVCYINVVSLKITRLNLTNSTGSYLLLQSGTTCINAWQSCNYTSVNP